MPSIVLTSNNPRLHRQFLRDKMLQKISLEKCLLNKIIEFELKGHVPLFVHVHVQLVVQLVIFMTK